ncbi:hypothetical protein P7D63_20115 [Enterococcus raffinosus]|uniref:hypothetical protein n=1 Tax=Enterococcus raffinosus TaxID=71452 RepID=UPI00288E2D4B|nr:hypothetical protein [Enterococcus raffinosus]MDT2556993.1 hypothetical protein [Enterococcus raffinosus]
MRRYIQTIALYEDYSITNRNGQRIFINPIPAFVLETGKEHLFFVVSISLINVPEGTLVKSSFNKLDDDNIEMVTFPEASISDYLNIKGKNNYSGGKHTQMVFEVEADAAGFGYYSVGVSLELDGKVLEEDAVLVPAKKVGAFDE